MTNYDRVLPLALLMLATSACGGDSRDRFIEGWERDGREVPQSELRVLVGPEHCEWNSALFLDMLYPLNTDDPGAGRSFTRDPDGVMADYTTEPFVPDAELPDDAVKTAYRNDAGIELWRSEDFSTAYLVHGDIVEAWPSVSSEAGCD